MKKHYFHIFTLALLSLMTACQKKVENAPTMELKKEATLPEVPVIASEEADIHSFAQLLQKTLYSTQGEHFFQLLASETSRQFDGDFDYLVANLLPSSVRTNNTDEQENSQKLYSLLLSSSTEIKSLREESGLVVRVQTELDEFLSALLQKHPLLNIYMPKWGRLAENDDFLVVVAPQDVRDGVESDLVAYNKKGERVIVSSLVEPNSPYLVLSINERVRATPNSLKSASGNDTDNVLLKTPTHTYTIRDDYHPEVKTNTEEEGDTLSLRSVRRRSLFDNQSTEIIKTARFMSKSAMQSVESWWRGQPEVNCQVYFKKLGSVPDFFLGENSFQRIDLGKGGWYRGSRTWLKFRPWYVVENHGNWHIMRWVGTALATKMYYAFFEADADYITFSISFSEHNKIDVNIRDADNIGGAWVYFSDALGKRYQISNTFEFVVDQNRV